MNLIEAFEKNQIFVPKYSDINIVQKDYLELYIKKKPGEFSTFLHEFPFGQEDIKGIKNEFKIKGPYVFSIP